MSSLLEALQVSPARIRRRKSPIHASKGRSTHSPKMWNGVRVEVVLLDGRRLEVGIGPRLITRELIAMVASHFTLRESKYFSLALLDDTGHYQWLSPDRRLVDHEGTRNLHGRPITLYFLVKFYTESVTELRDAQTIELFYQQAKSLISKDHLEVPINTAFKLAALSIQASHGDYVDESFTSVYLKKHQLLPPSIIKEHISIEFCEEKVSAEHRELRGQSRGDSILQYMSLIEKLSTYGTHYYEVRDRTSLPWFLGLSHRGISQYDHLDKKKPRRVFLWKHLENLYFRERKFSIEVHDPKRVVHTLSSFNLYEDAIEEKEGHCDDLLKAITEDTTQVSVSRRTFGASNVSVYVWLAETQALCKAIWSMAIAQHQFYLDRKTLKCDDAIVRDLPDLAVDLSRSCLSLSTHSSSSNISRSGSHSSLHNSHTDSGSTESFHLARLEMQAALQQRQQALKERLQEKTEELRLLCLREGELTGSLPNEYPHTPGQPTPTVRKRVGTSFAIDENLINKIINKQEETVASIELEYEIQQKISSAALRLATETSAKKGNKKQRKISYQLAVSRLKQIEQKLKNAREKQAAVVSSMPKQKKKPRPVSDMDSVDDPSYTQESPRDSIGIDGGISLSPTHPPLSPRSPVPHTMRSRRRDLSPGGVPPTPIPHSAPPSPHKCITPGCVTPSVTSPLGVARSDSPGRPPSGYIPSSVYSRSQYRSQHYQTLATRCQSVPGDHNRDSLTDLPNHHMRTNSMCRNDPENVGGLYNIPQQRTSLASHSLDDLDSSTPAISTPHSTTTTTTTACNGNSNNSHVQQQQQHHRRNRTDSHDRYGSLDRRRAANGWLESRSMEHLDSLTPSHTPTQYHQLHSSQSMSQYPAQYIPNKHCESMDMSIDSHLNTANCSFETTNTDTSHFTNDVVDGVILRSNLARHRSHSGPGIPHHGHPPHYQQINYVHSHSGQWKKINPNNTVHRVVRTPSGRSYMETTFLGEPPNNQENIPPLRPTTELLPLRATTKDRGDVHQYHVPLRPTASVNTADILPPRVPSTELIPLRATKSSSELPPLKPTHIKSENTNKVNGTIIEEPLISLADAAKSNKKDRGKEWYETSLDSPGPGRKPPKIMVTDVSKCSPSSTTIPSSQSSHNVSTSSIGSTSSGSGSVFQSVNDGSESLNTSISMDSPRNHMMITAGTYQPSREITKPFEMADFYKYSVKFRKQSSNSSLTNGNHSCGGESPLSPTLPPRTQMLMSGGKPPHHPPSPGLVAQQSIPAPQQKGVYQPLTPLTCKPLEVMASVACGEAEDPVGGAWETTPLHQAVPATVTSKRAATLV